MTDDEPEDLAIMKPDDARQLQVPRGSPRPVPIVKPAPVKVKLRLLFPPLHRGRFVERPVKKVHCVLKVAKAKLEADTDENGIVSFEMPAHATRATLQVGTLWSVQLLMADHFAFLDDKGELERLTNLGMFATSDLKRFLDGEDELERLVCTGNFGKADENIRYRALKRFETIGGPPLPRRTFSSSSWSSFKVGAGRIDNRVLALLEEVHDR